MHTVLSFLLYFWQLPQNLLALCIMFIYRKQIESWKISSHNGVVYETIYFLKVIRFGVALGSYIILNNSATETDEKHEEGHCIQSRMLGPLYLIIVGILSAVMNLMSQYSYKFGKKKFYKNYYKRWPENWADKLGNVTYRPELI